MPSARRPGLRPARRAEPDLPDELTAATPAPRANVWGARIEVGSGASTAPHAVWEECRVTMAEADTVDLLDLTGSTLRDVIIDRLHAVQVTARSSRWREVEVGTARVGTLDLGAAEVAAVTFRSVRADYLNLAASQLSDVTFIDCVFGTIDAPAATLTRVTFEGCRCEELDTRDLRAEDLDVRGLDVASFTDLRGLRGATLSLPQAHAHASAFAAALGIRIAD